MKARSLLLAAGFVLTLAGSARAQTVVVAKLDGTINPAAADYIGRSIEHARELDGECLIITLNTPGGLLKSTRVIVSSILESEVPVVVYVAPAGSQAASAGVFITLVATVAAMAPGTNIGAATPVALEESRSIGSSNILSWKKLGMVGLVTGGGLADTDEIIHHKVPTYFRRLARGIRPGRNELESVNRPVTIGGVLVRPAMSSWPTATASSWFRASEPRTWRRRR